MVCAVQDLLLVFAVSRLLLLVDLPFSTVSNTVEKGQDIFNL